MSVFELGLALLEGIALIASPCILPILPLILVTSMSGGRGQPFGVILGFIFSFSLFAFASRWLIGAFHLNLDLVKNISLGLLAAFGFVLLSERLSEKFTLAAQGAANLGQKLAGSQRTGFWGGLSAGSLIGLIWTPCAGPILGAVLVQIIRQESDTQSLALLLAFSIGAGIPMLLIALTGRTLMKQLSFFQRHARAVRETLAVLILASVAFIASGVDATTLISRKEVTTMSTDPSNTPSPDTGLIHGLKTSYPAPELKGLGQWFNSAPLTLDSLRGKVVLIDFWTYSCINCIRTLPYLKAWDAKYREKGLVILGLHAPEFAFEQDPDNVARAIEKYGIKYPVAQDNIFSTWKAYDNRYWPAHYLIDQEGRVVYTHHGEGEYDTTEHNIRTLLGLSAEGTPTPETTTKSYTPQTPETYLGYARAELFAGQKPLTASGNGLFAYPSFTPLHHWSLNGSWSVQDEKIRALKSGDSLRLNFLSRKVYLVMGSQNNQPLRVSIRLNGKLPDDKSSGDVKNGQVIVDRHALYTLIDMGETANGQLDVEALDPGLELYAFTFGE
ncbi:MAG: cytochrome c biogenesis protein DipZ [Alphaproteobacteria bacterium]|nr:cytochrome c biogenesis protein DipZ [Alphaproteobacteria bacterium]